MLDVGFVNLVSVIVQNPKVTAINSCIEVDLTGQVVSDSIGTRMYSGNVHKTFGEWGQNPVNRAYLILRTFFATRELEQTRRQRLRKQHETKC